MVSPGPLPATRRPAHRASPARLSPPRPRAAGIESLREKRDEVNRSLMRQEEEKGRLQQQLRTIKARLDEIGGGMAEESAYRDELDTTIRESESALMKIMESSQTLLSVVQREQHAMNSRHATAFTEDADDAPEWGVRRADDYGHDDDYDRPSRSRGRGGGSGAGAAAAASGHHGGPPPGWH